jgi:hypothetical protein
MVVLPRVTVINSSGDLRHLIPRLSASVVTWSEWSPCELTSAGLLAQSRLRPIAVIVRQQIAESKQQPLPASV